MSENVVTLNKQYRGTLDMAKVYREFSELMYLKQGEIDQILQEGGDLSDINLAFDLQAMMNGLTYLSTTASSVLKGMTEMLTNMARAMKQ